MVKKIRYYKIISEIASGGFGKVYLATDTRVESQQSKCVIKKFSPLQIDSFDTATIKDLQERFTKEGDILRSLSEKCNQVPKYYDHFSENGEYYIVQEFIDGITLANLVKKRGSIDEKTVRRILGDTLETLEIVHNQKLIHRDLTPDNLMLREADNKIVILDYGSVKNIVYTVTGPDGEPLDLTISIGKHFYTPSEQWIGRPVKSSDIYSLGLSAIHLLTGLHPRDLEQAYDNNAFLWHKYAPRASEQIRNVLDRAIDNRWKNRYQSADEMREALEKTQFESTSLVTLKFTKEERQQWEQARVKRESKEYAAWEIVEQFLTQLEHQNKEVDRRRQKEDAQWKARVREARIAKIKEQQRLRKEEIIRAKLKSFNQFFHGGVIESEENN